MHCRKSLLFDNDTAWVKKTNNMFDVTMGSFDGAEICELVGLFLLSTLRDKFKSNDIGLYRDDGLALFKRTSGPQAERKRKEIIKHFKNHGLAITIQSNLHIVNFLDVTLNLTDGSYFPYRNFQQHHPVHRRQIKSSTFNPQTATLSDKPSYIRNLMQQKIIRQSQATLRGRPETKRTHNKFHVHDQRHLYTPTKYSVTPPQE